MNMAPKSWPAMPPEQTRIRDEFIRRRGYWADDWQLILDMAPGIMAAYTGFSAHSADHGSLDPKTREFIFIANTAVVTHIHPIGIETHGRNAIAAGATKEELVTLLALMGSMGIRGYMMAVDVLEEVTGATGACTDDRFAQLQAEYTRIFGVWDDAAASAIRADPGYFAVFLHWAAAPRTSGVLPPKTVALIAIAANASITLLDRQTLTREIRAALALGATPAEIREVCTISAGVSVHSLTVGVPIIAALEGGDQ
jgi:alkylhydroperoxidase/carboxymuconolactone decarboxylase family protein YurZ